MSARELWPCIVGWTLGCETIALLGGVLEVHLLTLGGLCFALALWISSLRGTDPPGGA